MGTGSGSGEELLKTWELALSEFDHAAIVSAAQALLNKASEHHQPLRATQVVDRLAAGLPGRPQGRLSKFVIHRIGIVGELGITGIAGKRN
jgi:hypothetical protein